LQQIIDLIDKKIFTILVSIKSSKNSNINSKTIATLSNFKKYIEIDLRFVDFDLFKLLAKQKITRKLKSSLKSIDLY